MTPQELKNSILQLAIQGKLVGQRPEEGTGEELYQQIQKEKQALIKAGKIKKGKPLPEITEDEVPFEIPETWKWVGIADVATLNPKNNIDDELETAFVPMTLVSEGYKNECSFEIRKWKNIKKGFSHFADGDIGVAKITPCFQNRKSVIFSKEPLI
jgi:type I restriction enzyme S subunit